MKIFFSFLFVSVPLFANAFDNSNEKAYYDARVQSLIAANDAKERAKEEAERPAGLARTNQKIRNLVAQKSGGASIVSPANFWIENPGEYYVVMSNGMGCWIYAGAYFRAACR